jgi:hypothetical protein
MFWIIETKEQLEELINKNYKKAFAEVVPFNYNFHPSINDISLVYFKPLDDKAYMICVNHSETLSVGKTQLKKLLNQVDELYVRDKKTFLYHFLINRSHDVLYQYTYNPTFTKTHDYFYNKYPIKTDINRIIPLVKHFEYCDNIYNCVKDKCFPNNKFFNNKLIPVFYMIESSGIKIDKEEFNKHFELINPEYSIQDDTIYTQYNLYTTTSRPSNRFNVLNFAALNKENNCRKSFIPNNDYFLEIDISSYHPTLLSKLINYKFDKPIYETFADYAKVNISEAKELMFKQLYGNIYKKYEDWDFFIQVKKYINQIWEEFNNIGYITTPISGYQFKREELKDMNPQKLLNYLLQSYETSLNVNIIWDVLKLLRGKNTKIVLYTYDAILLNIDKSEEDLINSIKKIFENYNLNIKINKGYNYAF